MENSQVLLRQNFEQIMGKGVYVIFIELCRKWYPSVRFKGNNSCGAHNFIIKIGNVQMIYRKFLLPLYFTGLDQGRI